MQEENERQLQLYFINLLKEIGYSYVEINDEKDLLLNFKSQLKSFNHALDFDFDDVYDYLTSGDKFSKFSKLRSSYNGVKFINLSDFSSNIFQVAQEVKMQKEYVNYYDVTILINGIPIVQIELKKSGVELKKAFNQIKRYDNHSYSGLYDFIQIFIISNKVHTRYFFNDSNFNYSSTYTFKDKLDLESFSNSFFIKDNLIGIVSDYIFKNPFSDEYLMVRPYQKDVINKVSKQIENNSNAYVWMSHNVGKTLTSILLALKLKADYKVIYTTLGDVSRYPDEFTVNGKNEFLNGVITNDLIIANIKSILTANNDDLIPIQNQKFIFVLNEYEKSNPRYSPLKLMEIFKNSLFYCFTSSPTFDENIIQDKTTRFIFENQVYSYSFKDALQNNNCFPVDVKYVNDDNLSEDYNMSSKIRINELSNYIRQNHKSQSILITSSVEDSIIYYENLKNDLNIVPILRFDSNDIFEGKPIFEYFETVIDEYNSRYNERIDNKKVVIKTKIARDYEADVIKRFKNGEIEFVLVDESIFNDEYHLNILGDLKNPQLNSIYLDCNLNYDDLFEALCMVNSTSPGNLVLFRDLRDNLKETIKLFSKNSKDDYLLKDYDYYHDRYNQALSKVSSSNNFIVDFKELSNYYNILKSFSGFDFTQSEIDEFNFYKDRYDHEIDIRESNKRKIANFKPKLIDQFIIDLKYVENLFSQEYENSVNHEEKTSKNKISINQNNNLKQINVLNNTQKTINIKNEYQIYVGGDTITNINLNDLIVSNDLENEDLGKVCPECGKKFESRLNYCSEHEHEVELVFVKDLIKYCPCCKKKFVKKNNFCDSCLCEKPLAVDVKKINTAPNKYFNFTTHQNRYSQIQTLLMPQNIELLNQFNLPQVAFDNILQNIIQIYKSNLKFLIKEYNIKLESLTTKDKLLLFIKSFVKTDYKAGGGDAGHFEFNEVFIDDRANDAIQITTLIHELSHFLLAEILEQIVSLILNTDKTDAVEAFVCYSLVKNEFNYLVDEYCAHTVEGRYAMFGYQDYGSYTFALSKFQSRFNEDEIEIATGVGNTFAHYILHILSSFIDDELREDIKVEFNQINDNPKYQQLKYETSEVFGWQRFSNAMRIMLTMDIKTFMENPEHFDRLKEYALKFKINNEE